MNILVVDDDKNIVSMISDFLIINQLTPISAYTAEEAMTRIAERPVDLIVLDVNLGEASGFELCKKIREASNVPIIFLTAKIAQSDKILGLGIGGDDYLTKPFDPLELVARIKSNLRRSKAYGEPSKETTELHCHHIILNTETRSVTVADTPIELSATEFHLLKYLMKNSNRILSRQELLINVWNSDLYTENTVNTYIKRLREKIEFDKNFPEILITIRGEGYILKA
ncbi:MAG: response regulator transcription factor [Clostridia bacterium]|nr:response regulator transcription factor [Clostridia bacterium]